MGKDIEIPANIEEINEKSEELKIKFDKVEISREEFERENRKLSNQKRWLDICEQREELKKSLRKPENKRNFFTKKQEEYTAKEKAFAFLVLALFIVILIVPVFFLGTSYGDVVAFALYGIVFGSLFLCVIVYIIYTLYKVSETKKAEKELLKIEDIEDLLDHEAIDFYNDCKSILKSHPGTSLEDIVALVGVKYEKNDMSSAKEYYYKGESDDYIERVYIEEENTKNKIKEFNEEVQKQETIRSYKGINKYLAALMELNKQAESLTSAANSLKDISYYNARYTPKQTDWAVAGGIGSALGGTALGLASAVNAQAENEKQQVIAEQKREISGIQSDIAYKARHLAYDIQRYVNDLVYDSREILEDTENINDKFNMFKFGKVNMSQVKSDNGNFIRITANYNIPETITLLSQKAILDGSLKLSVYSKLSGELVLSTYYIAPGYGQYNYKNAGFRNGSTISVDIPIFDNKVPDCNNLRCEITPDILWTIEENKEIFKKSNSDIDSHIEKYNNELSKISREMFVSTLN